MLFKNLRISMRIGKIQSQLMKQNYKNANALSDEVLSMIPESFMESTVLIQKGEAEFYLGNKEQALMCFNKAINIYKTFPKTEAVNKSNPAVVRAVEFIEYINSQKT